VTPAQAAALAGRYGSGGGGARGRAAPGGAADACGLAAPPRMEYERLVDALE
jgi:hypothetical protein